TGFLFLRKTSQWDPLALELDKQRIEAFYRRHGFFSARVTNTDVRTEDDGRVAVTIVVEEGKPTHVAAVDVVGAPRNIDGVKLGAGFGVKRGARFDHPNYLLAREKLREELLRKGYAHAKVEGEVAVNRDTHSATVTLRVDPGPIVHFGNTHVVGLERIPERT